MTGRSGRWAVAGLAALLLAAAPATPPRPRDPAGDELTQVLKNNPADRDVRHRRAAHHAQKGWLPEALADYQHLRKSDAGDARAAYGLAVVLSKLADWAGLETALGETPDAMQTGDAANYARLWH